MFFFFADFPEWFSWKTNAKRPCFYLPSVKFPDLGPFLSESFFFFFPDFLELRIFLPGYRRVLSQFVKKNKMPRKNRKLLRGIIHILRSILEEKKQEI